MHEADDQLQCVGNDSGRAGILQNLCQATRITVRKFVRTYRNQYEAEGSLDRIITGD